MIAHAATPTTPTTVLLLAPEALELPPFHPEAPAMLSATVTALAERQVLFLRHDHDLLPVAPVVLRGRRQHWYLGLAADLLAARMAALPAVPVRPLPSDTPEPTLARLAARRVVGEHRKAHWASVVAAGELLERQGESALLDSALDRRYYDELRRARWILQLLDLHQEPPDLAHRLVAEVHPVVALLDPGFARAILWHAERNDWSVRTVDRLVRTWVAAARRHWTARAERGLPDLTPAEADLLGRHQLRLADLPAPDPRLAPHLLAVPYPFHAEGLARLIAHLHDQEEPLA